MNRDEYNKVCDKILEFKNSPIKDKYSLILDKLERLVNEEYKFDCSSKHDINQIYKLIEEIEQMLKDKNVETLQIKRSYIMGP